MAKALFYRMVLHGGAIQSHEALAPLHPASGETSEVDLKADEQG